MVIFHSFLYVYQAGYHFMRIRCGFCQGLHRSDVGRTVEKSWDSQFQKSWDQFADPKNNSRCPAPANMNNSIYIYIYICIYIYVHNIYICMYVYIYIYMCLAAHDIGPHQICQIWVHINLPFTSWFTQRSSIFHSRHHLMALTSPFWLVHVTHVTTFCSRLVDSPNAMLNLEHPKSLGWRFFKIINPYKPRHFVGHFSWFMCSPSHGPWLPVRAAEVIRSSTSHMVPVTSGMGMKATPIVRRSELLGGDNSCLECKRRCWMFVSYVFVWV